MQVGIQLKNKFCVPITQNILANIVIFIHICSDYWLALALYDVTYFQRKSDFLFGSMEIASSVIGIYISYFKTTLLSAERLKDIYIYRYVLYYVHQLIMSPFSRRTWLCRAPMSVDTTDYESRG